MAEKTISHEDIRSGDLLVWSRDMYNTKSDLYLQAIRIATASKYAHLGIAWQLTDHLGPELMVVEATMPKIRVNRVTEDVNYYVIPMGIEMTEAGKRFLMRSLGLTYGLMDALRAAVGITLENDNKFQCAELAREYYLVEGLDLGRRMTPKSVVKNALKLPGKEIYRVIK